MLDGIKTFCLPIGTQYLLETGFDKEKSSKCYKLRYIQLDTKRIKFNLLFTIKIKVYVIISLIPGIRKLRFKNMHKRK